MKLGRSMPGWWRSSSVSSRIQDTGLRNLRPNVLSLTHCKPSSPWMAPSLGATTLLAPALAWPDCVPADALGKAKAGLPFLTRAGLPLRFPHWLVADLGSHGLLWGAAVQFIKNLVWVLFYTFEFSFKNHHIPTLPLGPVTPPPLVKLG